MPTQTSLYPVDHPNGGHIARLYLNQSLSDPEWGKNYKG
ncbi:hypothetical protein MY10362_008739, partial [Beauveria mimosiformis]